MKISKHLTPFFLVLIVTGIWIFCSSVLGIKEIFLPSPQATLKELIRLFENSEFWIDLWSSWYRVLIGFIISFFIAYPLAFLSLLHPSLKNTIFYLVEFFRYLPVPVFIPITILWFGIDDMSKILIIVLGTFAQMIPMFYDSAVVIDKKYSSFNYALKWSRRTYVQQIVLKGSAPQILDNSRICLGWAWTYLIVAEIVGAEHGIGYAMIRAQRYLATDRIFAYIIVIGLIGILTDRSLVLIRKKVFPWNK